MRIPVVFRPRPSRLRRPAFTLVELLVATTLSLVILGIMSYMFGSVTKSVNEQRSAIEVRQQLRAVANQLRQELEGITLVPTPRVDPAKEAGYFEYMEGPYGAVYDPRYRAPGPNGRNDPYLWSDGGRPQISTNTTVYASTVGQDDTVGDADDVIMFTSRNLKIPFRGRASDGAESQSPEAEVTYFVRGTTLYRRVLLVGSNYRGGIIAQTTVPTIPAGAPSSYRAGLQDFPLILQSPVASRSATADSLYAYYDVSFREEVVSGKNVSKVNTLGDLSKREYRFAHQPLLFPYEVRGWGPIGMPTIGECSDPDWKFPEPRFEGLAAGAAWWAGLDQTKFDRGLGRNLDPLGFDPRRNSFPWQTSGTPSINGLTGQLNTFADGTATQPTSGQYVYWGTTNRQGDDIILNNVLAFDVKIWDPEAPVYVDGQTAVTQGDPRYYALLSNTGSTVSASGSFVDLNYAQNNSRSWFSGPGDSRSPLRTSATSGVNGGFWLPALYDTVSTHYEYDGVDNDGDGLYDEGSDGVDNDGVGGVDDPGEWEFIPPYNRSPRGVQIKIRVFEPSTNEIREVSIVHYFVNG